MTSLLPRLIRSTRLLDAVEERIHSEFDAPPAPEHALSTAELLKLAHAYQPLAVLVTHTAPLKGADVAALPESVKLVATVSVGLDHLDVPALLARDIAVSNTPDVLTDCNADLAIMLILAASRRAAEYYTLMKAGWGHALGMGEMLGRRVTGKRLGIVGMGRIGQAVAKRARGFDMTILYHNRRRLDAAEEAGATYFETLEDMLPHCDILSLHMPGSTTAPPLINARTLGLLPRGSVLVNAARGSLIDEDALIAALRSGQLFAAGLDVFQNEPNPNPALLTLPNLFMTPHVGSATVETRTAMGMLALDNVRAMVEGKPLPSGVSA
ncbi:MULTISPECIES: 2-hydroxyacid dehydrogenase [Acetobacter]|uniref:Lactate dehydrogenase-like 2-hydroxyacid dehydrogenase n=1 Tax=Acetobacter lovaniensis TaxID=104100 RepID=A0A841QC55_9PROT|nr:D-glycerate dehydrogenase [Acetobacter lovaniensis]MBB6455833.1 lactate dehydrogenase-like 2-hydroxyacid dehydrogenase [Acetobacter lovaniensis]MCI1697235.1 D-glycerate dehydrogenase [Acetobacter lovaniensis]MCP1238334.1 D-glycerate dehydrogenase [Acetobacter lovaniensis]NHN80228.1 D-glycerate dehydrogenase [Acetobacter lovaniensis]GBQ67864.1 D-isomer specific 2-hydroxyacid dehydrogenase [Acetobacter lovaniensis NRIC 0474]